MSWLMFICLYTVGLTITEAKFHHEVGPVQDDSRGLSDKALQDMKQEILEQVTQSRDSKLEQLKQAYDETLEQLKQGYDQKLEQLSLDYDLMKVRTESLSEENRKLEKKMADYFTGHNTGKLESYINSTASNQGLATGVVAFLARNAGFVGASDVQIPFDMVDINIGNAYDITGTFTTPASGLYHFESWILPDSTCGTQHTCLHLEINGIILVLSCNSEYPDSTSLAVTVQLSVGNIVTITIGGLCFELYNDIRDNGFSGHLLYESI